MPTMTNNDYRSPFGVIVTVTILLLAHASNSGVHSLTENELYPFGSQDEMLQKQQDISSAEIALTVPIVFYSDTYGSIFVNDNGLLSFMTELPAFYNREFPMFFPIIAPMYSDIDIRGHGAVYYRETKEQELLQRATNDVYRYFSDGKTFRAQSLFIVTWHDVTPNENQTHLRNTAQAVIASDGIESYCFFLYPENGIQWIQGQNDGRNMPSAFTQIGFMASDGRYLKLKGSGTEQVKNYPRMSNVRRKGMFAFHCGNTGAANIIEPDQDYQDSLTMRGPETCATTDDPCLPSANCHDFGGGICCECRKGFYGNGRSCLIADESIRVSGKLNGVINDIKLEEVDLYTYVETKEGRVYTGLSKIEPIIGHDLQTSLLALSSIIGWLFAVPIGGGAVNGFTLTGGRFNRSVNMIFPQTGHNAVITEQFLGLDVFNFLNSKVAIHGTLPTIPSDSTVNLDDYREEFTRVSAGTLKSRLTHSFSFGQSSFSMPIIIDQTISFDECPHRPIDYHNVTARMLVLQNHIVYDVADKILRYSAESKISSLDEQNNPCAVIQCGPHGTCIVQGNDRGICACERGYQLLYQETQLDARVISGHHQDDCVDIDECQMRTSACSPYAECINTPGSYQCRCIDGFIGNGYECRREEYGCNNMRCDENADCIQTKNLGPRCICKNGYHGDGRQCQAVSDSDDDCRTLRNLCDLNAECKLNRLIGKYVCVCRANYRGDGIFCTEESESCEKLNNCGKNAECISDESSSHNYYCSCNAGFVGDGYTCIAEINSDDCSFLNNCHNNARCLHDPESDMHKCHCNPGFSGDGYRCFNSTNINTCRRHEDCSPNGECHFDQITQGYGCRCRTGFVGNGLQCNQNNECDPRENQCDPNALCRFNQANMRHECECNLGFRGDGLRCVADENVGCNIIQDCHTNASCRVDAYTLQYHCLCNAGFEGDGKMCVKQQSCNVLNNCDVKAECYYDGANYQCRCLSGFVGDGFRCRPMRSCNDDRSVCDRNADCQYSHAYKDYRCQCHYGFIGDGYQCAPTPTHDGDFMLFSQGMSILRMPLLPNVDQHSAAHGSLSSSSAAGYPLITKSQQIIVGLDVDCLNGNIFWSDVYTGAIYRAPYNGSSSEKLSHQIDEFSGAPEGIAVDWVSRVVYWTDSKKKTIEVSNLDGSLHKVLIKQDLGNPRGIAVNPGSGKVYWSDWNRKGAKIEFANQDGTNRAVLVDQDLKLPNNIVIDFEHNDLCWTDAGLHRVECINLYNTQSRRVIFAQASYPFDLTIGQGNIYWTDWETKTIHQIDRNGGIAQRLEIPRGGHGRPYGVVTVPRYCPRISNACSVNNGGCKHLCLPNDHSRTCACPDTTYDESDECNEV